MIDFCRGLYYNILCEKMRAYTRRKNIKIKSDAKLIAFEKRIMVKNEEVYKIYRIDFNLSA